jgi:hypothetical protein
MTPIISLSTLTCCSCLLSRNLCSPSLFIFFLFFFFLFFFPLSSQCVFPCLYFLTFVCLSLFHLFLNFLLSSFICHFTSFIFSSSSLSLQKDNVSHVYLHPINSCFNSDMSDCQTKRTVMYIEGDIFKIQW